MTRSKTLLRKLAPFLPYFTISIGVFLLHSAWLTLISYHAGIVVLLLVERQGLSTLRVLPKRQIGLACAAGAFGLSGGIVLYLLWPSLGIPTGFGASLSRMGLSGIGWFGFILYFSIINPGLEEVYWRGYLGSASHAMTLNDLLFSGYHLLVLVQFLKIPWLFLVFIVLAFAGWAWRQFARLGDGLLVPVISHFIADLAVILVIYHFSTSIS
jgi:membrane protease YdiL (CAAX protease family)